MSFERLHADVEGVGDLDRLVRLRGAGRPHLRDAAPRLEVAVGELLVEHPPVAGVADRVEGGLAGGDVVGLVEVATAPRVAEVVGDHDLRPVASYHRGDGPPEPDAVLQHAVREAQEVHGIDPDDPGRLDLFGLPHLAALLRLHAVDAGLAAGHHAVDDVLPLPGPPRHGGSSAELHVVGVRDHAQGALPFLGDGCERRRRGVVCHGASMLERPGDGKHRRLAAQKGRVGSRRAQSAGR